MVEESSLRRLLFLTTYRQIRSSFWVGREAARSKIKLAQKETRRQDRTPGRAPAAERGRGSGTGQSKASLGSCVFPTCVASCSSAVAQVQALRSGEHTLGLLHPASRRSWLRRARLLHLPQRQLRLLAKRVKYVWAVPSGEAESLANVAPDKGKLTCGCEWRVWF